MGYSIHDLHVELAEYYQRFRGVMAPENTYVKNLWTEIERREANRAQR